MIYFETERLIFRGCEEQDLKEFRVMNKDLMVMKYFLQTLTDKEAEISEKAIVNYYTQTCEW